MISMQSTVTAAPNQVSSELGDEVVILDLRSGVYHGLSRVGAFAWSLIQNPSLVAGVCDRIVAEYEVAPDRCQADLLALLGELKDKGLIECVPCAA